MALSIKNIFLDFGDFGEVEVTVNFHYTPADRGTGPYVSPEHYVPGSDEELEIVSIYLGEVAIPLEVTDEVVEKVLETLHED